MNDNELTLQLRDNAKQQLSEVKTIESGIEYLNKVKAIETWVKAEKKDKELVGIVTQQKIRTQRKIGQLIKEEQKKGVLYGGRGAFKGNRFLANPTNGFTKKLSDIDLSLNESSAFQKIASLSEDIFEKELARISKTDLSTNSILNIIKKEAVHTAEKQYQESIKDVNTFEEDIFNTDKQFNIIYADPPWQYWEGGYKNQSLHYPTMTIEEIKALPVSSIAAKDCILFLWVTFPILCESLDIIQAWGFKYSTCGFVWLKKNKNTDSWFFGNGSWTRANTELCLIATKGTVTRINASISQIIEAPVSEHSEKPLIVRERITDLVGALPRIELFSRNNDNDGWYNWGNKI